MKREVPPLVRGLTAIVNAIGGGTAGSGDGGTRRERRAARAPPRFPRAPAALRDDIALEFTQAQVKPETLKLQP
jgi:hypothetical protein